MQRRQHQLNKWLWLLGILLPGITFAADLLPTPTLELRMQAAQALAEGDADAGAAALHDATELAQKQINPYVRSNELRYIAATYASADMMAEARAQFAAAMMVANTIPTWNHRLYASIGVVEMQRATGDLEGVHDNGMMAVNGGLLYRIAETGEAAEMGRFFTALDGTLDEVEITRIRSKIRQIGNESFRAKALHALAQISPKAAE